MSKGNPYHVKSGPQGGQFTSGKGGGNLDKTEAAARKAAGVDRDKNDKGIEVGDELEFIHPLIEELNGRGEQIPFRVVELRGDRLLVEFLVKDGMPILPQQSVSVNEVRKKKK